MKDTVDFYNKNATIFFETTVSVDMTPLHQRFLDLLPNNGRILE